MAGNARDRGGLAEQKAAAFLEASGYTIVETNYSCRQGELDLVAIDPEGVLCFVEVRFRNDDAHGSPLETVGIVKRRRIIAAARHYLFMRNVSMDRPMRFDVLGITGKGAADEPSYEWVQNAFDETGTV